MLCVICRAKLDQGRKPNCGFADNTYRPDMKELKDVKNMLKKKLKTLSFGSKHIY